MFCIVHIKHKHQNMYLSLTSITRSPQLLYPYILGNWTFYHCILQTVHSIILPTLLPLYYSHTDFSLVSEMFHSFHTSPKLTTFEILEYNPMPFEDLQSIHINSFYLQGRSLSLVSCKRSDLDAHSLGEILMIFTYDR